MLTSGMIFNLEEQLRQSQEELRKWEEDKETFQNDMVLDQEHLQCDEYRCSCRGLRLNQIATEMLEINCDFEKTCYQILNNKINELEHEIQQTANRIEDMKEELRAREEAERRARENQVEQ